MQGGGRGAHSLGLSGSSVITRYTPGTRLGGRKRYREAGKICWAATRTTTRPVSSEDKGWAVPLEERGKGHLLIGREELGKSSEDEKALRIT